MLPMGALLQTLYSLAMQADNMVDLIVRVPCSTFSTDSTLMAAGFSESYIRLFSLKQEKLRGLRSDFQESAIRDCKYCM